MQNDKKEIVRSYFRKGLTAFLVVAASVLFYFFMLRIGKVFSFFGTVISALSPIILGFVIAYLVNPIVNFLNGKISPLLRKKMKSGEKAFKISNAVSVCVAIILFCVILVGIVWLVIPQFAVSIADLVKTLPEKIEKLGKSSKNLVRSNKMLSAVYDAALRYGEKWIETDVSKFATKLGAAVASGVLDIANFLKNLVVGIIVAAYVLFSKSKFVNQSRKIFYALFKEKTVNSIFSWTNRTHELFSGFISGKLIDSIIIGILCFIGTAILRIPYSVLISCIIGVTNVIPVFGPWIGGIPCTILVLLINPLKGLYLGIFIILLQTLDGNIIGPKILGSKMGLSTFWVIFAIIVGGGLFGVIGMLIGVPTFALIYHIISTLINNLLTKKNKSLNSEDYYKSNGDLKKKPSKNGGENDA